jgi:uncharacterized protein YxeA
MKKILALVAALILTISFSAVTFAQESPAAPPSGTAVETKKAPATTPKKSTKKKKKTAKKKTSSKKSQTTAPAKPAQ